MWALFRKQSDLLTFLGGPLDGYVEENNTPLAELPEILGILVNPSIVETLSTQRAMPEVPPTSLALYQQISENERRYTFVGSSEPEMVELNDLSMPRR